MCVCFLFLIRVRNGPDDRQPLRAGVINPCRRCAATSNCYGDELNYCITPQPIPRVDWGLFVAERKLVVLKLRRAELTYLCDDLLSMICLKLDDVFYVRTRDERALTVRDLSEGKIKMPDPPGMQIRKHLFFERDD